MDSITFILEDSARKDAQIQEQKRRIEHLESELWKAKQKIDELLFTIASGNDNSMKSHGRYWSPDEHERFLEGLKRFGPKDVKSIAAYVGTRNSTQVRTHAQKYFLKLEREKKKGTSDESKDDNDLSDIEKSNVAESNSGLSPSNDSKSPETTPPPSKPEEKQKKKSKKGRGTKRKHSIMDSLAASVASSEQNHQTKNPENSLHSIDKDLVEKIVDESRSSVLPHLRGWSMLDYSTFIEGLVAVQAEKDSNIKCKIIQERFLGHLSLDEVKKCYNILQNAAKKDVNSPSEPQNQVSNSAPPKIPQNPRVGSPDNNVNQSFGATLPFGLTPMNDPLRNFNYSAFLPNLPKLPIANVRYPESVPNLSPIESILKPPVHPGIDPFSTIQRSEINKFHDDNELKVPILQ